MKLKFLSLLLIAVTLSLVPGCKEDKGDPNPSGNNNNNNNNNNNGNNDNNGNNNNNGNSNPGATDDTNDGGAVKPEDLLTATKYKTLVIDIASSDSISISNKALGNFTAFIQSRVNKPGGVFLRGVKIPSSKGAKLTVGALRKLEKDNRTLTFVGDTVHVWLAVLNAEYSPDPKPDIIFSVAYGTSSMAVFVKKLNQYTLVDMVSRFTLETFCLEHEFCHLLGLTNNGTAMATPHQDEAHGHHCNNTQCLMYYKAKDNIKLVDLLGDADTLPVLDANCLADLKAAGGK